MNAVNIITFNYKFHSKYTYIFVGFLHYNFYIITYTSVYLCTNYMLYKTKDIPLSIWMSENPVVGSEILY